MSRGRKKAATAPKNQPPRMHDCSFYDDCLESAALSNDAIIQCNEKCSRFERIQIRPTMQACERDNLNKFERWGY